jgi:excisionase family DNA binding protein
MEIDRDWYTSKEAAAYLGVNLRTLYRYIRKSRRKPPVRRFGKNTNYRFPIDELKDWANGRKKRKT